MLELWYRMVDFFRPKKSKFIIYLIIVALAALWFRFLMGVKLYHSGLLYILVPYVVSVVITLFRSYEKPTTQFRKYSSHILTSVTILFSTSIIVGEGFVCILFFAPIYILIVTLAFLLRYFFGDDSKKYSVALPIFIIALSLEGTSSALTLPRNTYAEVQKTSHLSVDQIKENLAKPFNLNKDRNWLISIFPMPYHVEAGSLQAGDVHTVYTRYHRWFVTNTHEGKAELLIEKVEPNKITTRVLSDTTYFSTYLNGTGTEINLVPNAQGGTDITLRLNYRRNLDPAWYFHPLQKYGVSKMGELLIDQLMIRDET